VEELPDPDSEELAELVGPGPREVYRVLYESMGMPLTMQEIRQLSGLASDEQLDRRKRDLHPFFKIQRTGAGKNTRYELIGRKEATAGARSGFSERERAAVLAPGRCAMCGRSPLEDGVKLQVDHKIPLEWGGTDDPDNLQPLCEECNRGKKNLFASIDARAASAINEDEPHKRIGELLKAFEGEWIPSYVIGIVASAQQYQEDWQKRMRELRVLGWDYEYSRERDPISGKVVTSYRVSHWEPWPEGSVRAEIRRRESGET
jgi:5-methylcytosine-specific restriction endonuclease McrA